MMLIPSWFRAGMILDMIGLIESATSEGKDAFLGSQLHQDAVLRNLHTMTETTQRP